MREIAVLVLMTGVVIYAQFNWFRALCILILYTAVRDYPNLPDPIQLKGLNAWIIMLAAVVAGWLLDRLNHPRPIALPRPLWVVLAIYIAAELIATGRLILQLDEFRERAGVLSSSFLAYNARAILVDNVYNPLRLMLIGLLLADGIRTKRDLLMAIAAVTVSVVLYALVINRQIPLGMLVEQGSNMRRMFWRWIERHPNDVSREFGAVFWTLTALILLRTLHWRWKVLAALALPLLLIALLHSHSRGGYLGFVLGGVFLTLLLRSWTLGATLTALCAAVMIFAPNVVGRITEGMDATGGGHHDIGAITAGRDIIWPAAMEGVLDSPVIGHGIYGYIMSPALDYSMRRGGGEQHPHNAYLQTLLDHGVIGAPARLAPLVACFVGGAWLTLFRRSDTLRLAGVLGFMFASGSLIMGASGQQFGLNQNLFLFWCAAAVMARASMLPDAVLVPAAQVQQYMERLRGERGAPAAGAGA